MSFFCKTLYNSSISSNPLLTPWKDETVSDRKWNLNKQNSENSENSENDEISHKTVQIVIFVFLQIMSMERNDNR